MKENWKESKSYRKMFYKHTVFCLVLEFFKKPQDRGKNPQYLIKQLKFMGCRPLFEDGMVCRNGLILLTYALHSNISCQYKHLHFYLKEWTTSCISMLFLSNGNSALHDASNTLTICCLCFQGIVIDKAFFMLLLFLLSCKWYYIYNFVCSLQIQSLKKYFDVCFLLPYYSSKLIFIIHC